MAGHALFAMSQREGRPSAIRRRSGPPTARLHASRCSRAAAGKAARSLTRARRVVRVDHRALQHGCCGRAAVHERAARARPRPGQSSNGHRRASVSLAHAGHYHPRSTVSPCRPSRACVTEIVRRGPRSGGRGPARCRKLWHAYKRRCRPWPVSIGAALHSPARPASPTSAIAGARRPADATISRAQFLCRRSAVDPSPPGRGPPLGSSPPAPTGGPLWRLRGRSAEARRDAGPGAGRDGLWRRRSRR